MPRYRNGAANDTIHGTRGKAKRSMAKRTLENNKKKIILYSLNRRRWSKLEAQSSVIAKPSPTKTERTEPRSENVTSSIVLFIDWFSLLQFYFFNVVFSSACEFILFERRVVRLAFHAIRASLCILNCVSERRLLLHVELMQNGVASIICHTTEVGIFHLTIQFSLHSPTRCTALSIDMHFIVRIRNKTVTISARIKMLKLICVIT